MMAALKPCYLSADGERTTCCGALATRTPCAGSVCHFCPGGCEFLRVLCVSRVKAVTVVSQAMGAAARCPAATVCSIIASAYSQSVVEPSAM